jgi:hypothetical protein
MYLNPVSKNKTIFARVNVSKKILVSTGNKRAMKLLKVDNLTKQLLFTPKQ